MHNLQNTEQGKKAPLISFVITCHNTETWMLTECMESILALSLRPFEREIIVIDDGSEVSPVEELIHCCDDIIYIRKKNGGISSARNAALDFVHGKYIQFVDGDDYLRQAPYEYCLDIARYKENDMVMFDFTHNENEEFKMPSVSSPVSGTEYMHNNNIHGSACCYLFRRSIVGSLRFTHGISYGEDEEFTPQLLLRAENVVRADVKAYFYRRHGTSALHKGDTRNRLKRINDNLDVIYSLRKKSLSLPTHDSNAMQRRIAQLTMDYIYNIMVLTRSTNYVNKKLDELHREGLFPLPDKDYTIKYKWFRRMTNSKAGRAILMRTLPLLSREL